MPAEKRPDPAAEPFAEEDLPRPVSARNRRMRGFEAASGLLAERIRKAGEGRGFAVSRVLTQWPEIAGAELAAMARPVKMGYGREGLGATLTLLVSGPYAPIVEMQKEQLRARVNACYGYNAVTRIALTQTAAEGFAEAQAPFRTAPKAAPRPDPVTEARAAETAAGIGDAGLRGALERLAQNVYSRSARHGAAEPDLTQKG